MIPPGLGQTPSEAPGHSIPSHTDSIRSPGSFHPFAAMFHQSSGVIPSICVQTPSELGRHSIHLRSDSIRSLGLFHPFAFRLHQNPRILHHPADSLHHFSAHRPPIQKETKINFLLNFVSRPCTNTAPQKTPSIPGIAFQALPFTSLSSANARDGSRNPAPSTFTQHRSLQSRSHHHDIRSQYHLV